MIPMLSPVITNIASNVLPIITGVAGVVRAKINVLIVLVAMMLGNVSGSFRIIRNHAKVMEAMLVVQIIATMNGVVTNNVFASELYMVEIIMMAAKDLAELFLLVIAYTVMTRQINSWIK